MHESKIKAPNQVILVQIPDTHGIFLTAECLKKEEKESESERCERRFQRQANNVRRTNNEVLFAKRKRER